MDEQNPSAESFFERFKKVAAAAKVMRDADFENFRTAAQEGKINEVVAYAEEHSQCEHTFLDYMKIIFEMCANPKTYLNKSGVIEAIPRDFFDSETFQRIFDNEEITGSIIWLLYGQDKSEDGLQAAARLQAHITTAEIRQGRDVTIIPEVYLRSDGFLSRAFLLADKKALFVKVQNALVDHVAQASDNDLTTAAGFLKFSDFLEGADLWTKKISGIQQTNILSRMIGKPNNFTPVFR